jgi:hypothetical protein
MGYFLIFIFQKLNNINRINKMVLVGVQNVYGIFLQSSVVRCFSVNPNETTNTPIKISQINV